MAQRYLPNPATAGRWPGFRPAIWKRESTSCYQSISLSPPSVAFGRSASPFWKQLAQQFDPAVTVKLVGRPKIADKFFPRALPKPPRRIRRIPARESLDKGGTEGKSATGFLAEATTFAPASSRRLTI